MADATTIAPLGDLRGVTQQKRQSAGLTYTGLPATTLLTSSTCTGSSGK